jgi:hypothetical protein
MRRVRIYLLTPLFSFGKERVHPYRSSARPSTYKYIDKEKHPYASFTFRYRSLSKMHLLAALVCEVADSNTKGDLRSQMIIPWSPSPIPQNKASNGAMEWDTEYQVSHPEVQSLERQFFFPIALWRVGCFIPDINTHLSSFIIEHLRRILMTWCSTILPCSPFLHFTL